jgi:hypothetical protein
MVLTTIDDQCTIHIPAAYQHVLRSGDRVALTIDAQGRLIVTPLDHLLKVLNEALGMWSDREDGPTDGAEWVSAIRHGSRLDAPGPGDENR